jgi:hypothetical protein
LNEAVGGHPDAGFGTRREGRDSDIAILPGLLRTHPIDRRCRQRLEGRGSDDRNKCEQSREGSGATPPTERHRLLGKIDDKTDVAKPLLAAAKARRERRRDGQGRLGPPLIAHMQQLTPPVPIQGTVMVKIS